MKIGIDISPTLNIRGSQNKVRGAGKYIQLLKENLQKFDKVNTYIFFNKDEALPKDLDVVHYPYFDPFFLTLPVYSKIKSVVTVHDIIPILYPQHFPAGIKGRGKWHIQKQLLKRVNAIITDSECSKKDITHEIGHANSVHVVPLSISSTFKKMTISSKEKEKILKKYDIPDKFLLYVGDATWNKNLPALISAVKNLDIPIVLVGKALSISDAEVNPWNQSLKEVIEETRDDKRFIKVGFVPEDELVLLYNLAKVFVFPSLYEGFGLPVLEAMSSGCPVVTTKSGSLEEVGGDGVYYVDPKSSDSIKNGIEQVLNSQELQESLSRKGIEQSKNFNIEKTIKETVAVYQGV